MKERTVGLSSISWWSSIQFPLSLVSSSSTISLLYLWFILSIWLRSHLNHDLWNGKKGRFVTWATQVRNLSDAISRPNFQICLQSGGSTAGHIVLGTNHQLWASHKLVRVPGQFGVVVHNTCGTGEAAVKEGERILYSPNYNGSL